MSLLVGLLVFPLGIGLSVLAALAARLGVARLFGWRVSFLPKKAEGTAVAGSKQAVFVVAGFVAAYLLAALVFAAALASGGRIAERPIEERDTRVEVLPGRPAEAAGVASGDRIVSVAGEPVARWNELADAIRRSAGTAIAIEVERGGSRIELEVEVPPEGRIGVRAVVVREDVGVAQALWEGAKRPAQIGYAVGRWVAGDIEVAASGPVAIAREARRTEGVSIADWLQALGLFTTYYGLPAALVTSFVTRVRRRERRDGFAAARGLG